MMKTNLRVSLTFLIAVVAAVTLTCPTRAAAETLKTHCIFSSNMVIQRDKPIVIWGWAEAGSKVSVQFGEEKAEAMADGEAGRWEVTFNAREADATPRKLTVASGDEKMEMENIVIGDVWVMNGQSNPDGKQKNSEAINQMRDQAKACLARRLEFETAATGKK